MMEYQFSDKIKGLKPSAIREIFKATADPSIIPFSAGNPAGESFPVEKMAQAKLHFLTVLPVIIIRTAVRSPLKEKKYSGLLHIRSADSALREPIR